MEKNENNITRLLEMLDNPNAYSEQEILDIIRADEQTQETYNLMTIAKDVCRANRNDDIDVDEAWKSFNRLYLERPMTSISWGKIAAAIMGFIFISSIAIAAVRGYFHREAVKKQPTKEVSAPLDSVIVHIDEANIVGSVTFENAPLSEIINRIANYYHVEAVFIDEDIKSLRFHYEWNPEAGLAAAVNGLNHFKQVSIENEDNRLIVKRL